MATPEQIQRALANAQQAGDAAAVARLSAALGKMQPPAGGVSIGQQNPYAMPKAAAELANTQVGTARTRQQMGIDVERLNIDRRASDIAERRLTMEQSNNDKPKLSEKIRADTLRDFYSAMQLGPVVSDIEQKFNNGPGKTSGFSGFQDFLPTPKNKVFNSAAGKLRGFVKATQGLTGGENNSMQESAMNIGPFIPEAGNYDADIREKIIALRRERDRAFGVSAGILGGIPDAQGRITSLPPGYIPGANGDFDTEIARGINSVPPEQRQQFIAQQVAKRGMIGRGGQATPKPTQAAPASMQAIVNEARRRGLVK